MWEYFKTSLFFFCFFMTLCNIGTPTYAQSMPEKHVLYKSDYTGKIDSLEKTDGINKVFFKNIKLPALAALQYFPELDSVPIYFTRKKLGTIMAARPRLNFLFRRKRNREYLILLNEKPLYSDSVFNNLPFNAQVGIIGHELSHINYYTHLSNFGIIIFGFRYLFMKKEIERATDYTAIQHNLGWQLYDVRRHVLLNKNIDNYYRHNKISNYLSPTEIVKDTEKIHATK